MKRSWKYAKIGDMCIVERGGSPRPIDKFVTDDVNGINWIKIGDATESMYITKTAQRIIPEGVKKSRYVKPGDFLLSNSMSFGRPYILAIDGCIHDGWLVLRDESQIFDKRFLYYYLSSKPTYEKLRSMAVGGVVNNLNSEMVRGVFVPVPDKVEQSGVADVLDKVKNIITLRKQEHQRLDELIKARFVEMFSNENCQRMQLDSLAFGKGEYGAQSASIVYDANRPRYVRITDINDDGSLNDDFVSSSNYADDEQYKLCYGDFLFARMGATVGKTYAYKSGNQIFAGYLIRYKLNTEKILPEYLFVYTKTEEYLNWVQLNQSGAAQPGINAKKYGSLLIPTPKIEKQKEFVSFVAQIDKSKVAVQKSLEETQLLFDKLMQEYFG